MIRIKLKEALEERNINQKLLGQLANIREATISTYCNNTAKNISIDNINRICVVLDCDITDIVEFIKVEDSELADENIFLSYQQYLEKLKEKREQENSIFFSKKILHIDKMIEEMFGDKDDNFKAMLKETLYEQIYESLNDD